MFRRRCTNKVPDFISNQGLFVTFNQIEQFCCYRQTILYLQFRKSQRPQRFQRRRFFQQSHLSRQQRLCRQFHWCQRRRLCQQFQFFRMAVVFAASAVAMAAAPSRYYRFHGCRPGQRASLFSSSCSFHVTGSSIQNGVRQSASQSNPMYDLRNIS